ncbi:MAG: FG-GAP-like repeat-containing protein, partial [Planctomycetaceae bacterium]|nr:FG-GAP-like repeat-containing protein [Planctomycetaceae bacterium]
MTILETMSNPAVTAMTSRGWFAILLTVLVIITVVSGGLWLLPGRSAAEYEQDAKSAVARRDFAAAVEALEQAVRASPKRASAWLMLAEVASRHGQPNQACEALETAATIVPKETGPLAIQLGSRWMTSYDIPPAVRALRLATVVAPQSPDAYRLLAQIYGVTGYRRKVVDCLIELLKRKAFTRADLIVLSSVNPTINDPDRLRGMLQTNPADKSPLLPFAMQELDQNEIEKARKILVEMTDIDPDNDEAQGILGELNADILPREFLAWHIALSSAADENPRIWLARAKWLNSQGEVPTAVRCLLEAVQREPENLSAMALLGQLLKSLSDVQAGEFYTERSRRLQRILDLSERMTEPRANEAVVPMINELEAVGRYWEAWGWCVVSQTRNGRPDQTIIARRERLETQLTLDLPRTTLASLPNLDRDRQRYPLPDWTQWSSGMPTPSPLVPQRESTIRFEDRAEQAGLDFRYVNSTKPQEGRKIYETMGAGVAVLDYDRDGCPDLYFPQGAPQRPDLAEGPSDALYRNHLGEQYRPVTDAAGIHEPRYSQGVAAGDYDNDGFPDIYVSNLGRNRLFHNNGDGTYTDITDSAGVRQEAWTVSCAIADLNGDGLP